MLIRCLPCVPALFVGGLLVAAPLPQPSMDEYIAGRNMMYGRRNGVLLDATVRLHKKQSEDMIRIAWSLDYKGPRPPLIIAMPTLTVGTSGQTSAVFFFPGGEDALQPYALTFRSPFALGPYLALEGHFLKQKGSEPLKGELEIPVKRVAQAYQKKWPERFEEKPPKCYVQLLHTPNNRGETDNMDAWTGELASKVLPVPLSQW